MRPFKRHIEKETQPPEREQPEEELPVDCALVFIEARDAHIRGDFAEAHVKFLTCAEAGNSTAGYNLAVMLANGHGISRDLDSAENWAQKSVDGGCAEAEGLLAFILRKRSEEAEKEGDTALSLELLRRSAELGNRAAMVRLAEMTEDYDTLSELRSEAKKSPIYQLLTRKEKNDAGETRL